MFRKRKMKKALFSLLISLVLTGCGDSAFPEITDEAIAFKTEKYFFEGSSNDVNYYCFEYNGRKYVQYGTMRALPKKKDIDRCIGYIVQPDGNNKVRIYTLTDDENCDFLIDHVIDSEELMTPLVWRAEDTKGQDIALPKHVDPSKWYEEFWK